MSNLLIRIFLKNKKEDRKAVGYLGSFIGVISNILLFLVKFTIGLNINSVSLTADSFNNLSDVGTNIVAIIGFKLSSKPADKEHPFGHGRTEYISALIVSIIIILVGLELFKSSIIRIINPEPVVFKRNAFIILIFTILIKIWLSAFNKKLNELINSHTLEAAALDSISDVLATGCVLIALIVSKFTDIKIDGFAGIIVSLFILINALKILKDVLTTLIGSKPDPNLVRNLEQYLYHFDGIKGVHDLIIHDYGPNTKMATAHIEISASLPSIAAHEIIDKAERKAYKKFGIFLLLHFDPIEENCILTKKYKDQIIRILDDFKDVHSIHDFRIINNEDNKLMFFDIVVNKELSNDSIINIKNTIINKLSQKFPKYRLIITMEKENIYI